MGKNKTTEYKVVIGVPCSDRVMIPQTAQSIGGIIIRSEGIVNDFVLRLGCDIVSSRTALVREALERGATHLLFVDSDMAFPADSLLRLLAHDKDIVGVRYNRRRFPLEGTCEALNEESDTELYEGKYCGTGLMLINTRIFDKEWSNGKGGVQPWFSFGRDNQGMLAVGEDAWFCYSARDNGFQTWIDPTIPVKHFGEFAY